MGFAQEWADLTAHAKEARSVSTRLNETAPDPGGRPPEPHDASDLVVRQDDLGVVGNAAFRLHGRLSKKADAAGAGSDKEGRGTTARAAAELSRHRMRSGGELETTLSVWGTQVKTVLQMMAHISNHLDYSKKAHSRDEAHVEASLRHRDGSAVSVSEILRYVK